MFFKHTGIQFRIYPHNSISTPVSFWGWYTYSLFRIPAWSWLLRFRDRLCSFVGIRYHWLLMFFLFTSHGTLAYRMVSQGFTNLQMAQSLKCLLELMIFPFQRWDLSWFPALEGNVIHRHTFLPVFSWTFQKAEVQIKNKKGMLTQMTPPTAPLCNILLMKEIRPTSWYSKYSIIYRVLRMLCG